MSKPQSSGVAVARHTAITCMGMIVLYFAVPSGVGDSAIAVRIVLMVVAIAAVAFGIQRQLLRQIRQPTAPLGGLVIGIVAGLLLFSSLDYAIAVNAPGQFVSLTTRTDALYFALSTLITVGFGDIHASGQLARAVLCVQMVFNVVVLATTGSVVIHQIGARATRRRG